MPSTRIEAGKVSRSSRGTTAEGQPDVIDPDFDLAMQLLDGFADDGAGAVGITRTSYGEGEERAHKRVADVASELGLEIRRDSALNLYVTMPGQNRTLPVAITGSHLDSVPAGGNFDGAAGVAAGLAVLSGWRKAGFTPERDCAVMAIRAEESAWFPVSYPGSKAAFGILPATALGLLRRDTHRSLAEHIRELGGSPERIEAGEKLLHASHIDRFVELHIEQGPHLVRQGVPIGIVTGIRGSVRFRAASTVGAYAHSGATPRYARSDAVLATAKLLVGLDEEWDRMEEAGKDLVVTSGCFATERDRADFSKISGKVDFSIDVRSSERTTLVAMEKRIRQLASEIGEDSRVRFELGGATGSDPAIMDPKLRDHLSTAARALGIDVLEMSCGAGHDAAVFASQGVSTAMIFVRNENGSHNPNEAMDGADFAAGIRLLESILRV